MQASQAHTIKVFRALGQDTRLRVVVLLAGHDRSVDDLAKNMQQSQSVMSRHLRILAQAGVVVRSPREGRVFYKLTEDVVVRRIIDAALE